ncbi:MAG: cytidylate kinase-like family protein [Deltaproteobacteria bacterium]|nr:cytidylate kinase-like family protein [Deltaproteobacteria bacterium]
MPIITISRDSYSHGEEIARKVAERLGYACIGPEIIQRACDCMDLSFTAVEKALNDAPTFLEQLAAQKERCLAMFRAVFFETMSQGNVVYHGVAGHIFLADMPDVVKVRVIADFDERVREEMRRENLTSVEARKRLIRKDKERARWTKQLYGKDDHDPRLYDLYLNLHRISIDAAVAIIAGTAQVSTNGHMEMMRSKLKDMALAAKTEALLLEVFPEVEAVVREGEVFVSVKGSILQEKLIEEKARKIMAKMDGVKRVNIGVAPSIYAPF